MSKKKGNWLFGTLGGWFVLILLIALLGGGIGLLLSDDSTAYLVEGIMYVAFFLVGAASVRGVIKPLSWRKDAYVYIRLSPERIVVRNLQSGKIFDEQALLAVANTPEALKRPLTTGMLGNEAAAAVPSDESVFIRPFQSSPPLVADADAASVLLEHGVRATSGTFNITWPHIIIQWGEETPGGLAPADKKALQELGQLCGGKEVFVADTTTLLSDEEVKDLVRAEQAEPQKSA